MGDRLVVALTMDAHVGKGPGRPIQPWGDRAEMLVSLRCVDEVVESASLYDGIFKCRPNIIVKGRDWAGRMPSIDIEAAIVVGAEIRFTTSKKRSTTELIERIRCA
jgi:bifunctional ADP-heptose synthase (sugar kinase/adenylyltransferase)